MTIHLPAETALALALAMTDARYGLALKRNAAMEAIEDLINFLDDTDGDTDLEPWLGSGDDREGDIDSDEGEHGEDDEDGGDDEPWLGWAGTTDATCGSDDDRETDLADLEPSLAAPEVTFVGVDYFHSMRTMVVSSAPTSSQINWARGGDSDREDEHDGTEPENEHGGDVQDEPHDALDEGNDEILLGWPEYMDQRKASAQAPLYGDESSWGVA